MFERLQALKKKAGESIGEELQAGHVIKRRIEHLKEHSGNVLSSTSQSEASINQWKKTRLDRMLIEYFLRKGYYSTAQKLAQASNITDLTNIGKESNSLPA
ncbi:E3 ubiquitin-protein transferase MAEA-like [Diaphorina citri]|uniref:E3 ubiquitin-protein transferase MAEA n=1 Tax=Diaphorina citri TaxID=121845 RepID=A0A1S3DSF1_DIACI|nr:E3 ubiquitin-protein transferase MAEA-like [Diaphorina citri]